MDWQNQQGHDEFVEYLASAETHAPAAFLAATEEVRDLVEAAGKICASEFGTDGRSFQPADVVAVARVLQASLREKTSSERKKARKRRAH